MILKELAGLAVVVGFLDVRDCWKDKHAFPRNILPQASLFKQPPF